MSFDIALASAASRQLLVEAAHMALRVIRFRTQSDRLMKGLEDDRGKGAASLALQVLNAIQDDEHQPIHDLPDETAERYADRLAEVVRQRLDAELGLDDGNAEGKLNEIRARY